MPPAPTRVMRSVQSDGDGWSGRAANGATSGSNRFAPRSPCANTRCGPCSEYQAALSSRFTREERTGGQFPVTPPRWRYLPAMALQEVRIRPLPPAALEAIIGPERGAVFEATAASIRRVL